MAANLNTTTSIKVGDTEYQAPTNLIMSCVTISNMIDDLGVTPEEQIFIPTQQNLVYSTDELERFFMLFEFSQRENYTHKEFHIYANFFNLSQNDIDKYLILINFLDNKQFTNALCNYYAKQILENKFTRNLNM